MTTIRKPKEVANSRTAVTSLLMNIY